MRIIHPVSSGASHTHPLGSLRLLRSLGATLLANPLVFAVGGTCLWLLVQLLAAAVRARAAGAEWSLTRALSWSGCLLALTLLAGLALGHVVLMLIVGWRGSKS